MEKTDKGRRAMLFMSATAAAGAAAGVSSVLAQGAPATGFGAPLVELYVPAGLLSLEQKGAMLKGFNDVILKALKLQPDPSRRAFATIIETAEGGFGINGQPFVPARK